MRSHKNDIKKTIVSFLLLKVVLHMYHSLFGTTIKLENILIACVYLRFITLSAIAALNNIKVIGYYYRYRITLKSL